jgi:FAM192A/Fyv6, N-terminal domain
MSPQLGFRSIPQNPSRATSVDITIMEKQMEFVSTSTHIMDPANPSTPPKRPSPPPAPIVDPNDKRTLFDKLNESKAKKQEAFEEAYKFSIPISTLI